MKNLNPKQIDDLEALIDRTSISAVMEALVATAFGKAQHVEETWQDNLTARVWRKVGKRCDELCSMAKDFGL